MPVFDYKGLSKEGKNVRGSTDAENIRAARQKLKKDGIFVIDLKNKKEGGKKKTGGGGVGGARRVPVNDLANLTRQLATLLKANVPLVDSLNAVSDQTENEYLKDVMSDIKNSVNEGGQLHRALGKYPKVFDKIYVSMAEAGEASGSLDTILIRLAEFTESQNELSAKVKAALYYPIFIFVFMGALLMGIMVFLVPQMIEIFESAPELTMPWYTLLLIDMSNLLINYWFVIILAIVIGFVLFRQWLNSESGRKSWDAITLKLPIVGPISRIVAVARFTRTLSTLLNGGVPMLNAMGIVKNVVNNEVLAEAVSNARDNISEGESIAGPLKKSGQFPPLVIHMVNIGEKTGELENMLTQVSDSYDFQVKTKIEGLTALLNPAMIIFMGLVIGFIVFSLMMPMLEMANIAG